MDILAAYLLCNVRISRCGQCYCNYGQVSWECVKASRNPVI